MKGTTHAGDLALKGIWQSLSSLVESYWFFGVALLAAVGFRYLLLQQRRRRAMKW